MTQTNVENGGLGDISLSKCEISFLMNVSGVEDLGEALDVAAINLGRFGIDSFYVIATDPDTDRQWVIHNGEIHTSEELVTTHDALRAVLDERPSEPAEDDEDEDDEDSNEERPDGAPTE